MLFNHALVASFRGQIASLRQSRAVSYQSTRTMAIQTAIKYTVKPGAYKVSNEKNVVRMVKRSAKKNSCGTIMGPIFE